ncbi:MAG: ankyrin repeat domain-containing protein [bacterium]|nr:ankyrin repeat domain-containing protein [bacterium]
MRISGHRVYILSVLLIAALMLEGTLCHAADKLNDVISGIEIKGIDDEHVTGVVLDGRLVLEVYTKAGGNDPGRRADLIAARLKRLLLSGMRSGDIHTGTKNGLAAILCRDELIATVDKDLARLNGTDAQSLARKWADNISLAVSWLSEATLNSAVRRGNLGEVERFIGDGADVNGKAGDGSTPLFWAIVEGYKEIADLLIGHGADINAADRRGLTMLELALAQDHPETAERLIEHGADVKARVIDKNGYYKGFEPELGSMPLHWAAAGGHTRVAGILLDRGAEVNGKAGDGSTPLCWAVAGGRTEVAELLIRHGAEVNPKIENGITPLRWAATAETVELLIKHGADIKTGDKNSRTPLLWAAFDGRVEVAGILIKHGADINARDRKGRTPLYWAAMADHAEVVELLVKQGAIVEPTKQIVVQGKSWEHEYTVRFTKGPFRFDKHKTETVKASSGRIIYRIDGKDEYDKDGVRNLHGTEGDFPANELYSLEVEVDGQRWDIPVELWQDCYEPYPNNDWVWLSRDGAHMTIKINGGDGTGGYTLIWYLQKDGRHRRVISDVLKRY